MNKKDEIVLKIKVHPNASESKIKEKMADETWKIYIAAPAEKGKANKEIINFFSKLLKVSKNNVEIICGATEHIKLIRIKK